MLPSELQATRDTPGSAANMPHIDKIKVAYQNLRGRFYFMRPEIDANQPVGPAIDQLRAAVNTSMTKMVSGFSLLHSAFCEPVVETATISAVSVPKKRYASGRPIH